jgi:hypothetical protein
MTEPNPDIPNLVITNPLFPLGQLVMTAGVAEGEEPQDIRDAVRCHAKGDWGDVEDPDDNVESLVNGDLLLSMYTLPTTGHRVWVITERDRSVTTVLYPNEY